MTENKIRMPAVRIAGSELKGVLEEVPRKTERSPHVYNLPNGGKASRILMAGMVMDKWENSEGTTRGIKLIDPWGTAISFLASQWTPELMVEIDKLKEQEILMVMAKLSVYDSGERKVQYPKLEALWEVDLETVQIWKTEVESFKTLRRSTFLEDEEPNEESNKEFFADMNTEE